MSTEELQAELQAEFLEIVQKMIDADCPLPDNFKLYYCTKEHKDRRGHVIHIEPHLTYESARNSCGEDQKWEGKYDSAVSYNVYDSDNSVSTENYWTNENQKLYEMDMELEFSD